MLALLTPVSLLNLLQHGPTQKIRAGGCHVLNQLGATEKKDE